MKNRLCFFCLILSFITFLSCNFGAETFPYLIEELETSSYSEKGLFEHLGLRFKILNTGTKSIEKITVAFTVFDHRDTYRTCHFIPLYLAFYK